MGDMTSATAIDLLDNLIGMVDDNQENDYDTAFRMAIDALKAQADGDTISRQAAIAEIARWIGYIDEDMILRIQTGLKMLPPAQPETHEERTKTHECDCISRQDAIDAIEEMQMPIMRSTFPEEQFVFRGMSESLNAIKELPSAQSEQTEIIKEIRKWINSANRGNADYFIVDKIEEIINRYE